MCVIDIGDNVTDLHLAQADRLAPEPVAVVHLVCVAIEGVAILQRLNDRELGEHAQTAPEETTTRNNGDLTQ